MKILTPYDFQLNQIDKTISLTSAYRKVCNQLATGGGKTVEFSMIVNRYTTKIKKPVLILVHRKELMAQTRDTLFEMFNIRASLITSDTKQIPIAQVYIGMVESTINRAAYLRSVGLVIIDECHIAVFNKVHALFPQELIIGFTATPKSSSKKFPLNKYYNAISTGPQISELIKLGRLCQNVTRCPSDIVDKEKLKISQGEYDNHQMGIEYSNPKYVMNTVANYAKYSHNKKTMIFNVNVSHSKEVMECFKYCNFDARHVDAESKDRDEILQWFRQTQNAILCNVGITTMGFDEPTIQTVIVNRATKSLPLWLQMCGRGSRVIDDLFIKGMQYKYNYELSEKKLFSIIDMGGNWAEHGDWSDDRDWNYIFNNPDKPATNGVAPVKTCPDCEGLVHAALSVCNLTMPDGSLCGHVFDRKKQEDEEILKELVVVTKNIDVADIMEKSKEFASYYPLFEIGRRIVEDVKKLAPITQSQSEVIYKRYFELCREWHKKRFPKKEFSESFHNMLARQHFDSLMQQKNIYKPSVLQESQQFNRTR